MKDVVSSISKNKIRLLIIINKENEQLNIKPSYP